MRRGLAILCLATACGRVDFDARASDAAAGGDATSVVCGLDPSWTPQWGSLLAYLPFDGTGAVVNGSTVAAVVGSAGHATNTNGSGMAYEAGQIGQAIRFDGVDDVVALDVPAIDTTAGASVSVAFWFNWTGAYYQPGGWTMLVNFTQINLLLDDLGSPPNTIGFNTNNGDNWGVSNVGFANRWVHAVAIFFNGSSDQSQLFIDGALVPSTQTQGTANPATVSSAIKIAAYPSYPNYFPGAMDEIAIWNRALSPAEILALYDHQRSCN
jgi:hypothetical protein